MVNHGEQAQADAPNPLEYLVEEALTPELKTQFNALAENWLDADKQQRVTTELGLKLNEAYHHTIADIAGLHEGKDYSEDFGKESYKVAKRLFENDQTDYIHDHKQAKQVTTKFMLHVLHEMGTSTAHAIAHSYEHAEGALTDEERFELLKNAFQNELGIGGRGDGERGVSVDSIIEQMMRLHRAKPVLLEALGKLKNKYAGVVAQKKVLSVVTPERKEAYKRFVEEHAGERHFAANHGKTAFHDVPEWFTIHKELYNHAMYNTPYEHLERLGIEPGPGHH